MSEITTKGSQGEARRIIRLEGLFTAFKMPAVIFKAEQSGWDVQFFGLTEREVEAVAEALKAMVRP